MKNGAVKITEKVNKIPEFKSFTILGDPGCDGLGAEIITTFAKGLSVTVSDFGIILGDIVPHGVEIAYNSITDMMNTVAEYPLYILCGNHDTNFYKEFYGLKNYLLINGNTLFIILDNSKRKFEDETILFLKESLNKYQRKNIILLFHIPPPNSYTKNSISQEEWEKLRSVYLPYKNDIKYILCGHVHSFFEDTVDGIKLVVSGGAGARIEKVSDKIDSMKAFHHVLKFYFNENSELVYDHITLDGKYYEKELKDNKLVSILNEVFDSKCKAYVSYLLFAKDAFDKGYPGIAKLFRAAAESEFYHAKNHFNNLNLLKTTCENLKTSYIGEAKDVIDKYEDYLEYTLQNKLGVARYTFYEALGAEKTHLQLFKQAEEIFGKNMDIPVVKYFTCTSCGNTFRSDEPPVHCTLCGAPLDKIAEVI